MNIIPKESDEDIAQIDKAFELPKRKNIKSIDIGWKRKQKSVKTKRNKESKVSLRRTPLHDKLKKRIMEKGMKENLLLLWKSIGSQSQTIEQSNTYP